MSKRPFQIGDKVRFKNNEDSYGYDLGIGEVTEIFVDTVWDEENDEYFETGDEILQVYFPKIGMTFTKMDYKFSLA